jgi:hypothetical protein
VSKPRAGHFFQTHHWNSSLQLHTLEYKKAAAEALALLGQSRIANNLNQLAYHANIGALDIGEAERAKIDEAYAHVLAIRTLLVTALGKSS